MAGAVASGTVYKNCVRARVYGRVFVRVSCARELIAVRVCVCTFESTFCFFVMLVGWLCCALHVGRGGGRAGGREGEGGRHSEIRSPHAVA